jgi:hypothetical protein
VTRSIARFCQPEVSILSVVALGGDVGRAITSSGEMGGGLGYQRAHRSALPESEGLRVTYPIAGWHEVWDRLASGEPILIQDTHDDSRAAQLWRSLVDPPEDLSANNMTVSMWRDGVIPVGDCPQPTPSLIQIRAQRFELRPDRRHILHRAISAGRSLPVNLLPYGS